MSKLRKEVLNIFKKLHRTRQYVFQGDHRALTAGRFEINSNFRKNMNETNPDEIKKLLALANDVDVELRTNVIQAVKKSANVYQLRITPETTRLENVPFNEAALVEKPRRRKRGNQTCCDASSEAPTKMD